MVDDAGAGRKFGAGIHAIVRESGDRFNYPSRLVGWQCGFEPLFVAVHSYLDVFVDDSDAEEMAQEFLAEIGWFEVEQTPADYIL